MNKVIDLASHRPKVVWFIDIGDQEICGCQYREAGMTRICMEPHWSVVVEAPTVDRLCAALKKAEAKLAEKITAKEAREGVIS